MRNRGRQSIASLTTPRPTERLSKLIAPASLTRAEKAAFAELMESVGDGHLTRADLPLIVSYVQACLLVQNLAHKPSQRDEWLAVLKVQMALARSLRLTVQSRAHPRSIARNLPYDGERPWLNESEED